MNTSGKLMMLLVFTLLMPPVLAEPAMNFRVVLTGDQEVPAVETGTTGTAILHINQRRDGIRFDLEIIDAVGILGAAGSHLHCAPAGVNGAVVVFLAGASTPGFDGRLRISGELNDASIINPACGETVAELAESMRQGNVYLNVHSVANPAGEIRGQIQ